MIPRNAINIKPSLLPPLQNKILFFRNGTTFRLYCATNNMESVRWAFVSRFSSDDFDNKINLQSSYELIVNNASQLKHEGIYTCSSSSEFYVSFFFILCIPTYFK